MPFTLAHPAAVVPLARLLGRVLQHGSTLLGRPSRALDARLAPDGAAPAQRMMSGA